jgi:hypothetical protein
LNARHVRHGTESERATIERLKQLGHTGRRLRRLGGVYGFLTPSVNPAKKPGEWQTLEVTLVGRVVTVTLNSERVIDRQAIPGITGGALDSKEGEPGPILLQGDHGPIEFRTVTLTPAN